MGELSDRDDYEVRRRTHARTHHARAVAACAQACSRITLHAGSWTCRKLTCASCCRFGCTAAETAAANEIPGARLLSEASLLALYARVLGHAGTRQRSERDAVRGG
jgi:hypothetical protein